MTTPSQNMFLDLEGTVIEDWDSFRLMTENIRSIRHALEHRKIKEVHIFSFAIHDEADVARFVSELQPTLERHLQVPIVGVHTIQEMKHVDEVWRGCRLFDMSEFILLRGKQGAFESWAASKHPGQSSALIDDVVPNLILNNLDTQTQTWFHNITAIVDIWKSWR